MKITTFNQLFQQFRSFSIFINRCKITILNLYNKYFSALVYIFFTNLVKNLCSVLPANNCGYKFCAFCQLGSASHMKVHNKLFILHQKGLFSVHLVIIEKPNFLSRFARCWNGNNTGTYGCVSVSYPSSRL